MLIFLFIHLFLEASLAVSKEGSEDNLYIFMMAVPRWAGTVLTLEPCVLCG